ncbi:MAG: hypothetical protein DWQ37_03965 [Planctomycetota bacterium]|nr:MAG: hypothetical protein DWQ37_03965 [Planctomycetota bacterium]
MHVADLPLIAVVWDAQLIRWVVWVGLVLLTLALLLLIRTRWGQQPLGKCVALSLLAHVLLAIYMTTVTIVTATGDSPEGEGVHVALADPSALDELDEPQASEPWSAINDSEPLPLGADELAPLPEVPAPEELAAPEREAAEPVASALAKLPERPPLEQVAPPELAPDEDPVQRSDVKPADPTDLPPEKTEAPPPVPAPNPNEKSGDPSAKDDASGEANRTGDPNATPGEGEKLAGPQDGPGAPVPEIYRKRSGDHLADGGNGATKQSEAAVAAALRWLANHQSANGRWDARRLAGGAARAADGQDRDFAGATADSGLTGLALLALMAAGNTHLEGAYSDNVRRGLEFLLRSQDATGNLGATNNLYERMYCHAMATCAVSEAYALTRDARLRPAVEAAIDYTVRMQDQVSGGWRYQFGQQGDTSQLGWQVMSLKSAELGGIPVPRETQRGMERFLRSVALGANNGLACYQAIRPLASRSMTAEALACREFLGRHDRPETLREATGYLLQELPGVGVANHYYWYYATLALHQTQGDAWHTWNAALQKELISTQRADGDEAGSWDPDPVWGRCGGRVYSTSLCALCLEVYYRYLPLYVQTAKRDVAR